MKKYEASRGWRNNNPLNIRRGEQWSGLCARQTDPQFCQFLNKSFGYRAAVKILKSYARLFAQQGKPWTVENIVGRWAPPQENRTEAYLARVLQLMGRGVDCQQLAPLWTKPGVVQAATMLAAMTCVECGCPPSAVPLGSLGTGFVLAGLSDPRLSHPWWA